LGIVRGPTFDGTAIRPLAITSPRRLPSWYIVTE
jgi:hypothetical protein